MPPTIHMACTSSNKVDTFCVTPLCSGGSNSDTCNSDCCIDTQHDIACLEPADTAAYPQTHTTTNTRASHSLGQHTSLLTSLQASDTSLVTIAVLAPKVKHQPQSSRPPTSKAGGSPHALNTPSSMCSTCGNQGSSSITAETSTSISGKTVNSGSRKGGECSSCGGVQKGAGTVSSGGKAFGGGVGGMVMVAGGGQAVLHAVVSAVAASKLGIPAQLSSAIAECENVVCARWVRFRKSG